MAKKLVDVELRWRGSRIDRFTTSFDPDDPDELQALIEDMARKDQYYDQRELIDYQIRVRYHDSRSHIINYDARSR
ncbi:hypothetical protein GCM10009550_76490 [Actinocorallia libanotica]|uniref:Uncharacterized protein n=1 Tax=Actinocorallia libanotica TaxID=46162 RepID=A0ABP4CI67_9ACTN